MDLQELKDLKIQTAELKNSFRESDLWDFFFKENLQILGEEMVGMLQAEGTTCGKAQRQTAKVVQGVELGGSGLQRMELYDQWGQIMRPLHFIH